jgi:hypothetical protein
MCHPIDGSASTDVNQMLDDNSLVPHRRPEDRHGKTAIAIKRFKQFFGVYLSDLNACYGAKVIIGIGEQKSPNANEVTRNVEIDHLPRSIAHKLIGAQPTCAEDVCIFELLSLVNDVASFREDALADFERVQNRLVFRQEGDMRVRLTRDGASRERKRSRFGPEQG